MNEDRTEFLKWGALIGAILLVVWLLGSAVGLFDLRFWAPKREVARREVFENTPSFVHGKRQYLTRLHAEWMMADSTHRIALCGLARHEASTIDPARLTPTLQAWECTR